MLTSKLSSNKSSPVLTIDAGPVLPIATWLGTGWLLAAVGLLLSSLPVAAKLAAGGVLLAGSWYEWRRFVQGADSRSIRRVRWQNNGWRLQSRSGHWQSATLIANDCRFLWGIKLCWVDENRDRKSAHFFRPQRSRENFRRFRAALKLANIA